MKIYIISVARTFSLRNRQKIVFTFVVLLVVESADVVDIVSRTRFRNGHGRRNVLFTNFAFATSSSSSSDRCSIDKINDANRIYKLCLTFLEDLLLNTRSSHASFPQHTIYRYRCVFSARTRRENSLVS